jgi:hypothetical protein
MDRRLRIGLDLDGVLIDHHGHKCQLARERGIELERWQANSNLMRDFVPDRVYKDIRDSLYARLTTEAPPVAGALEYLPLLNAEIYIISARRSGNIRYAQDWLLQHGVYNAVPADHIFFCGSGAEKSGICRRLGVSLYLDDRLNVLELLPDETKKILFDPDGIAGRLQPPEVVKVVNDWLQFTSIVSSK